MPLPQSHVTRPHAQGAIASVNRHLVKTLPMRGGASLHLVNVSDERHVQVTLEPGLRIACVMQGPVEVGYGDKRFLLGTAPGTGHMPMFNAVALAETDHFSRRPVAAGGREATVSLCLTPQWLETQAEIVPAAALRFARSHLAQRQWKEDPSLQTLLRSLLCPPVMTEGLHALYMDGIFQLVASRALHALAGGDTEVPPACKSSPQRQRQMRQVRELLDSGMADQWRLQDIAQHCHMSAATLQRHFQQAFGMGVFEYQRQRRLRMAHAALQAGEMSIAEAAWSAGYLHPANFSTAFKRLFGRSPQELLRG